MPAASKPIYTLQETIDAHSGISLQKSAPMRVTSFSRQNRGILKHQVQPIDIDAQAFCKTPRHFKQAHVTRFDHQRQA
jgi:hypothetical protein